VLVMLYGYPGSGKSYLARQLSEIVQMAHVSADRIRSELFDQPRYDNQEDAIITHLMNYMSEEFLNSRVSVIYDTNIRRQAHRRTLRELAHRHHAESLLIWLQIDAESSYIRTQNRDRRTSDEQYAEPQTQATFDRHTTMMQNPQAEDYLVVSGKHTFATQKAAIMNRFYQMGLTSSASVQSNLAAPGLVNLIPNPQAGRVDFSRRNKVG